MKTNWADTANALAEIAAIIAIKHFRKPIDQSFKQDGSSVSTADLEIESAMRNYLQVHHPEHGILGEEHGVTQGTSGYTWVLDPIDGTASFLSGKPTFCTLIALLRDDVPILGLISQPILAERWLGIAGQRTLFNGLPIPDCPPANPNVTRFSCTTPQMFQSKEERLMYQTVQQKASISSYGGDAYAYGLLALGLIDIILEADLAYYDIAALIPIIEGVGGTLTDWQGCPITKDRFKGQALAFRHLLPNEMQAFAEANPVLRSAL